MNDKPRKRAQDFTALVDAVRRVHDECAAAVNRTVNTTLTLRNWVIGFLLWNTSCVAPTGQNMEKELSRRLLMPW